MSEQNQTVAPCTTAVRPLTRISAPMRRKSATWAKRLSNTFSTITETPSARQLAASIWACISVGKPGCGWVCNWEKAINRAGAFR